MRHLLLTTIIIASQGILGCKTLRPQSDIKHNIGDVSWDDGRWTYLDLNRDTFIRMNNSTYLDDTHVLSQVSTVWITRLHAAVVKRYPSKMAGIPHPKIIVMKKSSPDAFAAKRRTVSYKLKVKLTFDDANSSEFKEAKPLYLSSNGKLAHNIFPPEVSILVEDPADYSLWFSKIHAPCIMEKTSSREFPWAYGKDCQLESYLNPLQWSPEFITQAAPNWIIVTSGLFRVLPTEESFAAVLAHELAHYYRAHVVKDMKHYNFCYMLSDPNHHPVEREELKNLCRDLKTGRSRAGMDPAVAAAQVGLGVYTIEEEADELALEILSLAKIAPIKATDAWFALFEHSSQNVTPSEVPIEKCRELFSNNWRDVSGNLVAIPVGDYRDTHHSWCFRIFNTTNEIKTHKYSVKDPLYLDPAEWQRIQSRAENP